MHRGKLFSFFLLLSTLCLAQSSYTIQTIAGSDFVGDGGAARAALLLQPEGLALDPSGSIYVSDAADHRIRRFNPDGTIQTIAGNGRAGFTGDAGPAASAQLNAPYGLCLDRAGNLYVADLGNARVRRISSDGRISTVAGGGTLLPKAAQGLPATSIALTQPRNVAVDAQGNLYFSDFGSHRIYRVTPQGNLITFAGTGEAGYTGDGGMPQLATLSSPAGLAVDAGGTVYVADSGNNRVRRITGVLVTTLADATGKMLSFKAPTGVAVDPWSNIYVADASDAVTTLLGNNMFASVPIGGGEVAVDSAGRVYTTGTRRVKRYDGRLATSIAGTGFGMYAGDGRPAAEWRFDRPRGLARDRSGNLYIADTANGRVRRIGIAGDLKSVATGLELPTGIALDSADRLYVSDAKAGTVVRVDASGKSTVFAGGPTAPIFRNPVSLVFDPNDNLFVADTGTNTIRRITPDGYSSVVAGGGGVDEEGGVATAARLVQPYGLALDGKGNLWFTESGSGRLRRLDVAAGRIYSIRNIDMREPRGLRAGRDGYLYVTDAGLHRVLKVAADGTWWPIAGNGVRGFSGEDGPALPASLDSPSDLLVEEDSTVVLADTGNSRVRKLTPGKQKEEVVPAPVEPPAGSRITVLHAATRKQQPVAPGQLILLALEGVSYTNAAELQIMVGDAAALILSATPNLITAQMPSGTAIGASKLTLTVRGQVRATAPVEVAALAPGILGNEKTALVSNEDGTLNSPDNPAARGTIVSVFLTGVPSRNDLIVSATVGAFPAEILYAGAAPGLSGVYQLNIRTPAGFAPPGVVGLTVAIDGANTQDGVSVATQ